MTSTMACLAIESYIGAVDLTIYFFQLIKLQTWMCIRFIFKIPFVLWNIFQACHWIDSKLVRRVVCKIGYYNISRIQVGLGNKKRCNIAGLIGATITLHGICERSIKTIFIFLLKPCYPSCFLILKFNIQLLYSRWYS